MKGRVLLVFWMVALLAVLASVASYAWLAMNTKASIRGFEVGFKSDSLYLEISADAEDDYGKQVNFNKTAYFRTENIPTESEEHTVDLITYGQVPSNGAIILYPTKLSIYNAYLYGTADGRYDSTMDVRFYIRTESVIGGGNENFLDVTDSLTDGQSIVGYYVVSESADSYPTASMADKIYHVKTARDSENYDYVCLGKFALGEKLSGRKYWGYSSSTKENESQPNNIINVVSMDTPTEEYCLKKTVFLRGAKGSNALHDLDISSISVGGGVDYLTSAIRIMFVATSGDGDIVTRVYSHRDPESFNGRLFEEVLGNEREVVTVEIYIYFDGRDADAHSTAGLLNSHTVNVKFAVKDHEYN